MSAAAMPEPRRALLRKESDWTKLVPVAFVASIIGVQYMIYHFVHLRPMLQFSVAASKFDGGKQLRAQVEFLIFNVLSLFLVICYVSAVKVHPGTVPQTPEWRYSVEEGEAPAGLPGSIETKRSGERRNCKWCLCFKPDRAHHCRVCRCCILRMDHHCPWIYNCVGFHNYKFFFLLLFYSLCTCHFIWATVLESVQESFAQDGPFMHMFLLLFCATLAVFLGVLTTVFFGFHIWLMTKAMTTIEFCEKSSKKGGYSSSDYCQGVLGNINAALGDNPMFWLLPAGGPRGTGLSFAAEKRNLIAQERRGSRMPKSSARGSKRDSKPNTHGTTTSASSSNHPAPEVTQPAPETAALLPPTVEEQ